MQKDRAQTCCLIITFNFPLCSIHLFPVIGLSLREQTIQSALVDLTINSHTSSNMLLNTYVPTHITSLRKKYNITQITGLIEDFVGNQITTGLVVHLGFLKEIVLKICFEEKGRIWEVGRGNNITKVLKIDGKYEKVLKIEKAQYLSKKISGFLEEANILKKKKHQMLQEVYSGKKFSKRKRQGKGEKYRKHQVAISGKMYPKPKFKCLLWEQK